MVLQVALGVIVGLVGLKALRKVFEGGSLAGVFGRDGTYQSGGRTQAVNLGINQNAPPPGAVPVVQGGEAPQVGYDAGFENPSGYDTLN